MDVIGHHVIDTCDLQSLEPGTVFTWGNGVRLLLWTEDKTAVCLLSGRIYFKDSYLKTHVRIVKGAFHVEG